MTSKPHHVNRFAYAPKVTLPYEVFQKLSGKEVNVSTL